MKEIAREKNLYKKFMSIEIDINTGCVTKWSIPNFGEMSFLGSGCEFSDWFSFFAHERLGGFGIKIRNIEIDHSDLRAQSKWDVKTRKSHFIAEVMIEEKAPNLLVQSLKLIAQPSRPLSWLGDAVLRFVIPLENGLRAKVDGVSLDHKNSNTMVETENREVELCWLDGRILKFRWANGYPRCPLPMTPYLYARDQPANLKRGHKHCSRPAWVLHARLLVEMPAAFVFRFFRNPGVFWDRPKFFKILSDRLDLYRYWRAGEFQLSKRKQTQGLWPFKPGEGVELEIELEAINR